MNSTPQSLSNLDIIPGESMRGFLPNSFSQLNISLDQTPQNQSPEKIQETKNGQTYFKSLLSVIKFRYFVKKMIATVPSIRQKSLKQTHYKLIGDRSLPDYQDFDGTYFFFYYKRYFQSISKYLCLTYIPAFIPSNFFKLLWDTIQILVILLLFFVLPINAVVDVHLYEIIDEQLYSICIMLVFIDMGVNMNTGYFEKGVIVTDRFKIIKNYFENNMIQDILTDISLLLVDQFPYLSIVFLLKMRIFSHLLKKIEESFHLSFKVKNLISLFKLLASILFISHIFACLWLLEAKLNKIDFENDYENWTVFREVYNENWLNQYIMALYFVVVTMATVGYGDVSPKVNFYYFGLNIYQNNIEFALCILTMLISCGVFAHSINTIGNIFQNMQQEEIEIQKNLQVINNFMKSKKISFGLQYQIREYLEYFWKEAREQHHDLEQNIINQLSSDLKDKLQIEANKIVLKDSQIFNKNFTDKFIHKCVHLIQEIKCQPGQIIQTLFENQQEQNIYFIEKGRVQFYLDVKKKQKEKDQRELRVLKRGQVFGYYSFFTGINDNYKIQSLDFTKLLVIKRQDFMELLNDFPEDYERFCFIKDQMVFGSSMMQIGQSCESCGHYSHNFLTCPLIHPHIDYYRTIRKYNIFEQTQFRKEKSRQVDDKYHSIREQELLFDRAEQFQNQNESYLYDQSWVMSTLSSIRNSDDDENSPKHIKIENRLNSEEDSDIKSQKYQIEGQNIYCGQAPKKPFVSDENQIIEGSSNNSSDEKSEKIKIQDENFNYFDQNNNKNVKMNIKSNFLELSEQTDGNLDELNQEDKINTLYAEMDNNLCLPQTDSQDIGTHNLEISYQTLGIFHELLIIQDPIDTYQQKPPTTDRQEYNLEKKNSDNLNSSIFSPCTQKKRNLGDKLIDYKKQQFERVKKKQKTIKDQMENAQKGGFEKIQYEINQQKTMLRKMSLINPTNQIVFDYKNLRKASRLLSKKMQKDFNPKDIEKELVTMRSSSKIKNTTEKSEKTELDESVNSNKQFEVNPLVVAHNRRKNINTQNVQNIENNTDETQIKQIFDVRLSNKFPGYQNQEVEQLNLNLNQNQLTLQTYQDKKKDVNLIDIDTLKEFALYYPFQNYPKQIEKFNAWIMRKETYINIIVKKEEGKKPNNKKPKNPNKLGSKGSQYFQLSSSIIRVGKKKKSQDFQLRKSVTKLPKLTEYTQNEISDDD